MPKQQQITVTDKDVGLVIINVLDLYLIRLLFAVPGKAKFKHGSADRETDH